MQHATSVYHDFDYQKTEIIGALWQEVEHERMKNEINEKKKRPKVFLSYSYKDNAIAQMIAKRLQDNGIDIWSDLLQLATEESVKNPINKAISASDYLIVLLSKNSIDSKWTNFELNLALNRELKNRDVTILPVLIGDCRIPADLSEHQFVDLRFDFEKGISNLIDQVKLMPEIDFSMLSHEKFEDLIIDLLRCLGFTDIEKEFRINDNNFDVKAIITRFDPFGLRVSDTWIIEIKFYKNSKADLKSINQFASKLLNLPENYKGLLITNGAVTSASQEWLKYMQNNNRISIRIIDSTELKRLLLKNKTLVNNYFKIIW